ncbi:YdeI family protein [Chloroflexota bacterium]
MTKQLYFANRDDWRDWLERNHTTKKEAWLIHYKKHTGKPGIRYEDAVEEALCFGWIDGKLRSIDSEKYALRYSPRRKNSVWSESNKKRAERMIIQGRMVQVGLTKIRQAQECGEWHRATLRDMLEIPPDLEKRLVADKDAGHSYKRLTPSRQKQLIWWITSAKREETRQRRIDEIIRLVKEDDNSNLG